MFIYNMESHKQKGVETATEDFGLAVKKRFL